MYSPVPSYESGGTPGTGKRRGPGLIIPKRSSLDGRIAGSAPGTPGTPLRLGGGYGDAHSSSVTSPFPPRGDAQLYHRRTQTNTTERDIYHQNQHQQTVAGGGGYSGVEAPTSSSYSSASAVNYSCWIVVFGLSEGKNAAREYFSGCGEIIDSADSAGNWIFLEFKEPSSVERALRFNGKVISSGMIIGVERLTPTRATELNLKVSSRAANNDSNRQEISTSQRDANTPSKYLRPPKKRESICNIILRFFGLDVK